MPPRPTDATHTMEVLYRAHYGFVWQAVRRFGVVPALTDDAVQDTFVTAFRRFDELATPTAKAWLYGIARRIASNYRRADFRSVRRRAALAASTTAPTDMPSSPEIVLVFDRFLRGLDPIDRELFVLSEIEGMTGPEAATALSLNTSTTYSRVQVLRRRFREACVGREPVAVVTAVREQQPRASTHGWFLLLPKLGLTLATRASSLATIFGKAAAIACGVTLGAAAATTAVQPASDARPVAMTPVDATARVDAPASRVVSAGLVATPASLPPPTVQRASSDAASTAPTSTSHARPAREAAPGARSIERDNRMMLDAKEALGAGDAAAALAITGQHAREFPGSALADARSALRIEALCALDKREQARGEARVFANARPGSPVAARIERSCAGTFVESAGAGQAQGR